ncbi:MAG: septal ring lytic transglycosylase RlpA family protein [Rickettsiaceae bacterium]|nr:septal ring lytic transglycosylase RlpA family protein [Rickettsiaceae bacterium]
MYGYNKLWLFTVLYSKRMKNLVFKERITRLVSKQKKFSIFSIWKGFLLKRIALIFKLKKSKFLFALGILLCITTQTSCGGYNNKTSGTTKLVGKSMPAKISDVTKYKGHYKSGKKYKIKGKTYRPYKKINYYNKVGIASWYGFKDGFHGKKTANGDTFSRNWLTAAHKTLPMPSLVKVTNLNNGRSVIVMVNDRGPFAKNREIDLSEKAASILKFRNKGIAKVRVQYLNKETKEFLRNIGLNRTEGARATKILNNKCGINCRLKLVNLKHNKTKKSKRRVSSSKKRKKNKHKIS